MKFLTTLLFLFMTAFLAFGQEQDTVLTQNSQIDRLIDDLSWESITCDHSYHTFIVNYQDSTVKKLIHIGLPTIDKLLESIENPEKTVIIHMILTKILEPNDNHDYLPIMYIYKDCNNLIGWHHIFNGLIWEWHSEDINAISPQEIAKVKNYWTNRISGKIKKWENNIEDIFQEIAKSDSIKYPCYKIYENNSSQIRLNDLMELFDYDFSSDKFNEMFTILGNDSTISRYNDCHYVSYGPDGLSFRFDIHNNLTTIFVKEDYQGEMPLGLKYTDNEKKVERKIGKPNKSNVYGGNYKSVDYTDQRLHINYNENGQIIKFAIMKK